MQIEPREQLLDRLNKTLHKRIVLLAVNSRMTVSQVELVLQKRLAICAAVQHNRKNAGRINAGRRGVDHQLSDRNVHSVRTPVPYAQNSLGIRCNNQAYLSAFRSASEGSLYLIRTVNREIAGILRVHKLLAVLLNTLGNDRVVDNGHELYQMLAKYVVKEGAVVVKDIHEKTSLLNQGTLLLHLRIDALRLELNGLNRRRQQPLQLICLALLLRKCRPLVEERIL